MPDRDHSSQPTAPRPTSRGRDRRGPPRTTSACCPDPVDGSAVLVFALLVGVTLVPVDVVVGALVAAAVLVVLVVAVVRTSPVVTVTDGELRAGAARIPAGLLAAPRVLDRDGVRAALGPGSDARTYACVRTWVPGAVLVEVADPADPTPAWLVSSRRPETLLSALVAAGASPSAGG